MAELVDAQDLKSCEIQPSCRFKSGLRHQTEKYPSLVEGTGLENREVEQSAQGFESLLLRHFYIAGWSSSVARRAHNPKVIGSNPIPATIFVFGSLVQLVNTSACHAEDRGFESRRNRHYGFIAQSVEQRTENPCVAGSIPAGATKFIKIVEMQRFFNYCKTIVFIKILTFFKKNDKL